MRTEIIWSLLGIISVLGLDTLLGICVALRKGEFEWGRLPQTLKVNVLPYVISLGGLGLIASIVPNAVGNGIMESLYFGLASTYAAKLIYDLKVKLAELFGAPGS